MRWWPLFGLFKRLTEKSEYPAGKSRVRSFTRLFRRSLFVYVIDVGSSNALNFEISALESAVYNIHRFGIYLTDSPRHADLLLVLGRPTAQMLEPLEATIDQIPRPFGIVTIDDFPEGLKLQNYPAWPNHLAALKGVPSAGAILGTLLTIAKPKKLQP